MDDTGVFEAIYVEFRDRVSRYVHSRVGNFHDAQDVMSGVFLKIETALGRYDSRKASLSSCSMPRPTSSRHCGDTAFTPATIVIRKRMSTMA